MRKQKASIWALAVVICVVVISFSASVNGSYPEPLGFASDFANVMDQRSEAEIQVIAEKLQKEQGIEIAVVTVQTTQPLTPKEYATALFESWGIGGPEDSGLLILVSIEERRIEVEVGYGLEATLPDGRVGAILDDSVMSHLSSGQYGPGLSAGVRAFGQALSGEEFSGSESGSEEKTGDWLLAFVIFALIAILLIKQSKNPPGGPGGFGGRRTRMGGFYGPRFPGGKGGGFGGGGFGGFGGGRSGGGGAGRGF